MREQVGFSEDDNALVEDAIVEAEKKTSVQILTYVTQSSDRYHRAEDVVGILFTVMTMICVWLGRFFYQLQAWQTTQATDAPSPWDSTFTIHEALLLIGGSFVLGVLIARVVRPLKRFLVNIRTMEEEVQGNALLTLREASWTQARGKPVLLIYVSRFEKMVEVVADETVAHELGLENLMAIRQTIVRAWREGRKGSLCHGLREGVEVAGALCGEIFPPPGVEPIRRIGDSSDGNGDSGDKKPNGNSSNAPKGQWPTDEPDDKDSRSPKQWPTDD
ncbi:MAG TPA: hypothetical protein PL033_18910 [Candidatus Brocadiia bacterium]|nr:hypothetical protein [Candidatus Brocadiia bacterium]